MTTRAVISCDGDWHGNPCRGAIPVGVVMNGAQARYEASRQGWTSALLDGRIHDFCPACAKKRAEHR